MNSTPESRRKRYRAPDCDGGILIEPPLASSSSLLDSNLKAWQNSGQICGEDLVKLRARVREFAYREAIQYTQRYSDVSSPNWNSDTPWIVSGHQPELFHPGVWFKNHLLDKLRSKHSAIGLHVIVDNDLCTKNALRVPTGSLSNPLIANVAYDDPADAIPHEEQTISNRDAFASFGARASDVLRPLIENPMLREHWAKALDAVKASPNTGVALSRIRHEIEIAWGSQTIEVPLSRLCTSREFYIYFLHFAINCSSFVEIYNEALAEYRSDNRIRSQSHPVPALSIEDGLYELPFWVWQTSDPRRKRLFIRRTQNSIELSDLNSVWRLSDVSKTDLVLEQIAALALNGVRIRPRALMTTMFCRLLLADVFIHGIGGAKYDELTERICRRMNIELPRFICATSTVRLPLDIPADARARINQLRQLQRQTRFHPENFFDETIEPSDQVSNWIASKLHWIELSQPKGQRIERHLKIEQANLELQHAIQAKVTQLEHDLHKAKNNQRIISRLGSREFSFLLFPESHLRSRMNCDFRGG